MPVVGTAHDAGAADGNAALAARFDIERVIAGAGGDQELQVGEGFDNLAREGGAFAHADDDREALQGLDRFVLAGEGFVEHLDLDVLGDPRPVGECQRHILVIVENSGPNHAQVLSLRPERPGRATIGMEQRNERGFQPSGGRPCLARQAGPGPRM